MSNKHQRLKNLEKLAAIAKSKTKSQSLKTESDRLSKETAALTNEELNAKIQIVMDEIRNSPPDPELEGLSTQGLIERYAQLCRES